MFCHLIVVVAGSCWRVLVLAPARALRLQAARQFLAIHKHPAENQSTAVYNQRRDASHKDDFKKRKNTPSDHRHTKCPLAATAPVAGLGEKGTHIFRQAPIRLPIIFVHHGQIE